MPDISHYRVLEKLGTGGMGTVYRAEDQRSGDIVALKTLHSQFATSADYVRRFEAEARIAQSIDSPNVVKVLDYGHDGDTYFLVMEYVPGSTLADVIKQRGVLPVHEAVSIASAIARALVAANAKAIVHRDISPQNVILTPEGLAKVTDFGVSRDLTQEAMTATSMLMGKPLYIAPEVVTGTSKADIRADIYALGVIVFQMLAGRVPFDAETPFAVMQKHVSEQVPSLSGLRAETPRWLIDVAERCLEKDPRTRFQQPEAVLAALLAGNTGPTVRMTRPWGRDSSVETTDATATMLAPRPRQSEPLIAPGKRSLRLSPMLIAGIAAGLAIIVLFLALSGDGKDATSVGRREDPSVGGLVTPLATLVSSASAGAPPGAGPSPTPSVSADRKCTGGDRIPSIKRDGVRSYKDAPARVIDPEKTYTALLKTNKGDISLSLAAKDAPNTVNNFVFLACHGFYDGLVFHRVVKDPQPFVVQGGDPRGNGSGGPGYIFNDEISPKLKHEIGAVAMANAGPNTSGSQFYITLSALPSLDGKYNVFGKVTDGQSVVNSIAQGDKILSLSVAEQ